MQLAQHRRVYYPSADAPGLARSVEAALLSARSTCGVRFASGLKRTAYSATASYARATRVRNETDWLPPDRGRYRRPCFMKTRSPLASSGRTRDSIPHGVRSAKVSAKHARYLGPGCSDRGLPISRTASFRAPSSADERFDILFRELDRRRFQESVSQTCRPNFQAIFGRLKFSQRRR